MLIRLTPLADELDRGYLGRLMRINGIRAEKDMFALMFNQLDLANLSRFERAPLEALSRMAGLTTEQFTQQHSTLPLRRSITSYLPDLPHGCGKRRTLLYNSGMLTTRSGAYFCPLCVKADINFHGVAYWRRELQIPGRLWCDKHEIPLQYVATEAAFLTSPFNWLEKSEKVPEALVDRSICDRYVNRFLEICEGMIVRDKPLEVRFVSAALRCQAERRGLETVRDRGRYPLLSDVIRDSYPREWLTTVYPDLVNKVTGKTMVKVDGVLFMGSSSSSVWPYLLAAGVLYDDADEAQNALINASTAVSVSKRRSGPVAQLLKSEELLGQYVRHKGSHSSLAKEQGVSLSVLKSRLAAEGLPDLTPSRDRSKRKDIAVIAFYLEEKSLAQSCQLGGLSMTEMESLIRRSSLDFQKALRMIWPEKGIYRRSERAMKGLSPIAATQHRSPQGESHVADIRRKNARTLLS